MQEALDKFKDYLKANKLKFTAERKVILEKVFSIHDHFDAEELLFQLKQEGKQVSRASVYRTLNLLVECNLVDKVDFGEDRAFYEHTFGHVHHDHLICTSCGTVVQFEDPGIEERQEEICKEHGYKLDYHVLSIFGLCPGCRGKERGDA